MSRWFPRKRPSERQLSRKAEEVIAEALYTAWPMVNVDHGAGHNSELLAKEAVLWLRRAKLLTDWRPRVWWDEHPEPNDYPDVIAEDDNIWTWDEERDGWVSNCLPDQAFSWPGLLFEFGPVVEKAPEFAE